MTNKYWKFLLGGIGAAGVFLGSGFSLFEKVFHIKKRNRAGTGKSSYKPRQMRMDHPRHDHEVFYEEGKAWCAAQTMKDYYMASEDGLRLHASFLPAPKAERIIILCHGYRGSGFGDFAGVAKFLHENHCHLLFIDERCCGESEGEYITFGVKEQLDIRDWAVFADRRNCRRLPIYLFGMSMGAASVLMASGLKLPERVKGLIADCGYHSLKEEFQDVARSWFHLKYINLMMLRIELFCRLFAGFSAKEADTTRALISNRLPILFFHGEDDGFVQVKHTRVNYVLTSAPKEILTVPGEKHMCSVYGAQEQYREMLRQFFETYDT